MKIILLILMTASINLMAQVEMGVVSVPVADKTPNIPSVAVKTNVYTDKDGDTVTILDSELRTKIADAKKIRATNLYDNEIEIDDYKKEYEQKILKADKSELADYLVVEGDTLKGISQKLYGTTKRWKELFILNEEALRDDKVKAGTKIKYKVETKEKVNERQELPNETK